LNYSTLYIGGVNRTPIKTENDYRATLKRIELLFDAPIDTPESDEADTVYIVLNTLKFLISNNNILEIY